MRRLSPVSLVPGFTRHPSPVPGFTRRLSPVSPDRFHYRRDRQFETSTALGKSLSVCCLFSASLLGREVCRAGRGVARSLNGDRREKQVGSRHSVVVVKST